MDIPIRRSRCSRLGAAVTVRHDRWPQHPHAEPLRRLPVGQVWPAGADLAAADPTVGGSVPEPVMNASSLIFQGWTDDLD